MKRLKETVEFFGHSLCDGVLVYLSMFDVTTSKLHIVILNQSLTDGRSDNKVPSVSGSVGAHLQLRAPDRSAHTHPAGEAAAPR